MGTEHVGAVTRSSEEDPAPVVDQLRDVFSPLHLGHVAEQRLEQLVEDHLPIEAHHQVMDVGSCLDVDETVGPTIARVLDEPLPAGRISAEIIRWNSHLRKYIRFNTRSISRSAAESSRIGSTLTRWTDPTERP